MDKRFQSRNKRLPMGGSLMVETKPSPTSKYPHTFVSSPTVMHFNLQVLLHYQTDAARSPPLNQPPNALHKRYSFSFFPIPYYYTEFPEIIGKKER